MITYDEYLSTLKVHEIVGDIAGKSEEEISEYEAKMYNNKKATLNILGHVFVVLFVVIALIAFIFCIIKAFDIDTKIVEKGIDKVAGKAVKK